MFFKLLYSLIAVSSIFLTGCGSTKTIISVSSEKEANEIVAILSNKGISAKKEFASNDQGGSWGISVPSDKEYNSIAIITRQGFPRAKTLDIISIFSPSGLMPSSQEDQIRYQAVLEAQLSNTIKEFDGIIDAAVNISLYQNLKMNERDLRSGRPTELKASVYVKHTGILDNPSSQMAFKIKKIVAGRLIGLDPENVYVVGERVSDIGGTTSDSIVFRQDGEDVTILGMVVNSKYATYLRVLLSILATVAITAILGLLFFAWKMLPVFKKNWKTIFSLKQVGEEDSAENKKDDDDKDGGPEGDKGDKSGKGDPKDESKDKKPEDDGAKDNKDKQSDELDDKSLGI